MRERTQTSRADLKEYCETALWGFDFDPRASRVAKALMLFAGVGHANIYRINSLLNPFTDLFLQDQTGQPFLTIEHVMRSRIKGFKGFDAIVTNPPFAGEIREKHILTSYSLYRSDRRLERDVLFLERCVQLLRPGGRMAIVLPHNKLGTSSWTYLREWLMRELQVVAVIGLGRNTFLPHTHQKTGVLIGIKRNKALKQIPVEDIFFGISERDGKDSKGQYVMLPRSEEQPLWSRCDHDLSEIHAEFARYCAQHGLEWGAEYGSDFN
jgi:type I restriction enzyme M protein